MPWSTCSKLSESFASQDHLLCWSVWEAVANNHSPDSQHTSKGWSTSKSSSSRTTLRKIWKKILRNTSKSLVASARIAASSLPIPRSKRKNFWSSLTWFFQPVKFRDFLPRTKRKPSWEMPELIMSRNSRAPTLPQVSFTTISLTELEITCTSVSASHPSAKNSEIGSENSPPCSTSARLIGSYPGPKRPWFQWLSPSSKNSKSLTLRSRQSSNWWSTWVTSTWWWPTSATFISQKWEDRSTSHPNHISAIFRPTRNCICSSIRNSTCKNLTSRSVSRRSMKLQRPLQKWRKFFHKNRSNLRMLPKRQRKCWRICKLSNELLRKSKPKSMQSLKNVRDKPRTSLARKKKPKENWQLPFPPRWEPKLQWILWMPQVSMRWRPTKNPNKFWSLCSTLSPSTSTWNWRAFRWSPTSKWQKDWIFPSGKTATKKVESSFSVPSSISWRTSRLTIRTQSATRLSNFWSHCWSQELSGSTIQPAVRCPRPSLPSASGSTPSSNTTKNHRSWSPRRLSSRLKKPISKSPRRNWQRLVRSWE